MSDGSTITVASDDESGWSELKSWYESNESEEEPSLQYRLKLYVIQNRVRKRLSLIVRKNLLVKKHVEIILKIVMIHKNVLNIYIQLHL